MSAKIARPNQDLLALHLKVVPLTREDPAAVPTVAPSEVQEPSQGVVDKFTYLTFLTRSAGKISKISSVKLLEMGL